jgi:hypothetical protein
MFELKPLSKDAFDRSLEKAQHYRLLGDGTMAESICRDLLALEPNHQKVLEGLLLALTDQFGVRNGAVTDALEVLSKIEAEYKKAYLRGLIYERHAMSRFQRGGPGSGYAAYGSLRKAMDWYEKAEGQSVDGNDDAILRWNTCARIIDRNASIEPAHDDGFQPLLDAAPSNLELS